MRGFYWAQKRLARASFKKDIIYKMKQLIILIGAALMAACSSADTPALPGSDRDEHNCIASAGYTWSQTRKACIRLWEEGITLSPVAPAGSASFAAFAVQTQDYARMEVFIPEEETVVILQQTGDEHDDWTSPTTDWNLRNSGQTWELLKKDTLRYQSKAAKTN